MAVTLMRPVILPLALAKCLPPVVALGVILSDLAKRLDPTKMLFLAVALLLVIACFLVALMNNHRNQQIADLHRHGARRVADHLGFDAGAVPSGFVSVDPARLAQCLGKLLSNALRDTRAGGAPVELTMTGDLPDLSVTDSGPGAPAEAEDRLFRP